MLKPKTINTKKKNTHYQTQTRNPMKKVMHSLLVLGRNHIVLNHTNFNITEENISAGGDIYEIYHGCFVIHRGWKPVDEGPKRSQDLRRIPKQNQTGSSLFQRTVW